MSIALSVCVLFGFSPSKATCSVDPPIPGWIEIGEGGGEIPRMPLIIPIRGIFWGNTIYLSFSEDLGDVDVTLEEYNDGLILHTVIDTSSPTAIINFSGDSGDYVITFTLSSGDEYVGLFTI